MTLQTCSYKAKLLKKNKNI